MMPLTSGTCGGRGAVMSHGTRRHGRERGGEDGQEVAFVIGTLAVAPTSSPFLTVSAMHPTAFTASRAIPGLMSLAYSVSSPTISYLGVGGGRQVGGMSCGEEGGRY